MKISIIIPTLNEEKYIGRLIKHLCENASRNIVDLIVVDGGSEDRTVKSAQEAGATVINCTQAHRAIQMNLGAQQASGEVLYFLHGDTFPPSSYVDDISQAVEEGFSIGSYRLRMETIHPMLRLNSYMTRFPFLWCRGGDQSLFITRKLFDELGGYRQDYCAMEEYDLITRAKKRHSFKIIPKDIIASARKYKANGYFRVQLANFIAFNMFRLKFHPQKIATTYKRLIRLR